MSVKVLYSKHHRHTSLGNNILQYLAGNYFSKKYDLMMESDVDLDKNYFDINKCKSTKKYENYIEINDNNILYFLNNKDYVLESGVLVNGFFQQKEIFENSDYLNYSRSSIIPKIPKSSNIDLFVHVRLNDISDAKFNLPFDYYDNQIQKIKYDSMAISTDTADHPIIQQLLNKYKHSFLFESKNPSHAISAASNSKNLIIGSGSFGFCMALFATPETNIYCINHDQIKKIFDITIWDGTMVDALRKRSNTYFY